GSNGQVAAERAGDNAREQKQPERTAEYPDEITDGGAGDCPLEYSSTSPLVRNGAPERCENKLQDGKEGTQDSAEEDCREGVVATKRERQFVGLMQEPAENPAVAVGIQVMRDEIRPEWKDNREPDQINVERQENDSEGKL